MNNDVFGYIIGALAIIAGSWLTARSNLKMKRLSDAASSVIEIHRNELNSVRVDGEAYERAQRINDAVVLGLRSEIDRLNGQLVEMRNQIGREQNMSRELRIQVATLQMTVDRMSALLRQHNVSFPPPTDGAHE